MLIASAFGNGLGFLLGIVLARLLGAEDFGLYAISLAVFNIVVLVSLCGGDTAVVRFVSIAIKRGDSFQAGETVATVLGFAACTGALATAVLLWSSRTWLLEWYGHPRLTSVFTVLAFVVPLALIATVLVASLQAMQAFPKLVFVRYVWDPCAKLTLAMLAVSAGWGIVGVAGAIGMTAFLSGALAAYFARALLIRGFSKGALERTQTITLLRYGLPLSVMTVMGVIAPRSDVLFLGYWVDPVQVGLYQAAYQTAAILTLIAGAFDTAFAPLSAGLFEAQNLPRLHVLYRNVSRWLLTASFPIALILIVFGSDILQLFGTEFPLAAECLLILALAQCVNSWTTFSHTILLMSGRARLAMWDGLAIGGLLILFNWLLIPRWGIVGAACAVAFSMIIGSGIRLGQVWIFFGLHPFSFELVKPLCAGLATISLGYWTKGLVRPELLFGLAVSAGLLYLLLLYVMKLEESDRLVLAGLRRRMVKLR
jgi:O-antigen/teichoic acid export membrane protein